MSTFLWVLILLVFRGMRSCVLQLWPRLWHDDGGEDLLGRRIVLVRDLSRGGLVANPAPDGTGGRR